MVRVLIFLVCLIFAFSNANDAASCFPMSRGWGSGPGGISRSDWWCSDSLYGFLGFSYPVEDDDCGDYSYNGFKNDFSRQKTQYNATFVRVYLPTCRQTSLWVNMVKAARDTSMGLIPMIFWDWQQNDPVMNSAENALLGVFNDPEVGSIATYIIHSVAFGDELGEQGNYWVNDLKNFKAKLAQYQVPITITDDWDRSVYKNGAGMSSFGQQINSLSDLTHAHIQPYYHPSVVVDAFHFWPYFYQQMQWLSSYNKRPIFVSQTMWAYDKNGHERGEHDEADNMQNYQAYFGTLNANCTAFRNLKIGWFFHTWYGEPGFDLIGDNGNPVYNWKPTFC